MLKKRKKHYLKEIITAICLITVFCMMFTGCSGKKDKNGSMKAEDGRSYGGLIEADTGETISTAFFDLTVEEALKYNTYQFEDGLYQADKGNTYLVVKLTVKNTYEKDIPMSITDFTLDYDGNDSKDVITGYGKADLKQDDFMENIFTLKKGESVTRYILFTVIDEKAYTLNYAEYYEDKFEVNKFQINLKPETKTADSSDSVDTSNSTEDDADTGASDESQETSTEAESQTEAPENEKQTETEQE